MSKFYGPIGFVESTETYPGSGVWEDIVTEKNYRGEVTKNYKRWDSTEYLNDNLLVNNIISIVADPFINNNLYRIRYIKWLGTYWKINTAEVQSPRIILNIGGVYNGPVAGSSGDSEEHPRI